MFISTKVFNCCQAHQAELLADYDFVFLYTLGKRNPADGPSCHPDYVENLLLIRPLILLNALCLLLIFSSSSTLQLTNALFANLIGMHTTIVSNYYSHILASYNIYTVVHQYLPNPMFSNWSYKDVLLLYKGFIYSIWHIQGTTPILQLKSQFLECYNLIKT